MHRLSLRILDLELRVKERRALIWTPKPFEMSFEELKRIHEEWERGELPQDDYVFGLIENHKDFFLEFITNVGKARKMSSNLSEEILMNWLSKLRELKLIVDIAAQIEGLIKVRSSLRSILSIVQKSDMSLKNNNLIGRIVEEITSWNRKNLNEEEFERFKDEFQKISSNEGLIDTKDYDWIQFQLKIAGYEWRQEVRLKSAQNMTDKDVKGLLRKAPKDLKASKCSEWNSLVDKSKDIEWLDDKQIIERIMNILNDEISESNRDEILKFVSNASICAVGEEAIQKSKALEKVVLAKCSNYIEDLNQLEDLVKEMLDAKFWNTVTFTYFDDIHRIIQSVNLNTKMIGNIKLKIDAFFEKSGNVSVEVLKKYEKIMIEDVEILLNDFKALPEKLTRNNVHDFEVIRKELESLKQFLARIEEPSNNICGSLIYIHSGKQLEKAKEDFRSWITSYFKFAIRSEKIEELLANIEVLIKACELLEGNPEGDKKDIAIWELVLGDVKKLVGNYQNASVIVSKLESPLSETKEFLKTVHSIKHGSDKDKTMITLTELKKIFEEKKENPGLICVKDSLDFLENSIKKAEQIEAMMKEEKMEMSELKESITFMENISLRFDDKLEKCKAKIQAAEEFKERLNSQIYGEKMEKTFEQLTEEYNRLEVRIPEVEEKFNRIQECKNLRREAERLLTNEEATISEILEIKDSFSKMPYFKSANMTGKIFSKLFYKMRETYESNQEENPFTIEYSDMCRLIKDAQDTQAKKCRDEVRLDLKEKTGFINQIFKDVNDHLNKTVYNLSLKQLKETELDLVFRGFVNIAGPVQDYKKKLEEKDNQSNQVQHPLEMKKKEKEETSKSISMDVISQDSRAMYTNTWGGLLGSNKYFSLEQKDPLHIAKMIEKEVYLKFETRLADYEKHCEEISRLLKEIATYYYLSADIKAKRFSFKSLRDLFGKTSAEIRNINYSLSKSPTQNPPSSQIAPSLFNGTHSNPQHSLVPHNVREHKDSQDSHLGKRSRRADTEQQEDNEHHTESGVITGEYKYYRIYMGEVMVQYKENVKFGGIQMLTCNKSSLIANFSYIPQNVSLSTKITKDTFIGYINKVISGLNISYKILFGYVNMSNGQERLKKMLFDNDLVASKQYTEKCKIFVFPREFLLHNWCDDIEIVFMNKDVDLMYFLTCKLGETEGKPHQTEQNIVPEPMSISGVKPVKLINNNGKLREHTLNLDFMKEIRSIQPYTKKDSKDKQSFFPPQLPAKSKDFMESVKTAELGIGNILEKYNKKVVSNYNLQPAAYGSAKPIHNRDVLGTTQNSYSFPNKYKQTQKSEWGSKENSIERMDSGFENDLIGTLQSIRTTNKNYQKPQSKHQSSIHYQAAPSFAESGSLLTKNYQQSRISEISKLLSKRPSFPHPSLSNNNEMMLESTSNLFIPPEPIQTGYEKKSFLQSAISSIQIPQPISEGNNLQIPSYDKQPKKNLFGPNRSETYHKNKRNHGGSHGNNLNSTNNGPPVSYLNNQFL